MTQTRKTIQRHNNPATWLLLGFFTAVSLPVFLPKFSQIEGRILPVTTQLQIVSQAVIEDGVTIYVSFEKLRQCDFLGLVWYEGSRRLTVDFAPDAAQTHPTRPVGLQVAGPWLIKGVSDLEGTEAFTFHRCNDWWTTVTSVYP